MDESVPQNKELRRRKTIRKKKVFLATKESTVLIPICIINTNE